MGCVSQGGEQGLLVPPGDPRELATAITRLVNDDELRREMSASGIIRAETFSWERITERVETYYGFVIRRLASQGALPPDFSAEIPPSPRILAPTFEPSADAPPAILVPGA